MPYKRTKANNRIKKNRKSNEVVWDWKEEYTWDINHASATMLYRLQQKSLGNALGRLRSRTL